MIVFELSMPNIGSWNGHWSGEKDIHIITKKECMVPKSLIGQDFYYRWDDGWTACISVYKMSSKDSNYKKLIKNNKGFYGYDWMVNSLLRIGKIEYKN